MMMSHMFVKPETLSSLRSYYKTSLNIKFSKKVFGPKSLNFWDILCKIGEFLKYNCKICEIIEFVTFINLFEKINVILHVFILTFR